ncbi:MAG TPA: hypothetical protein VF787_23915 [Thermoanaerobaculia bacterium]
MKRALALAVLIAFGAGGAPTRNNDDSCDIAVLPAATLLLPYFEVGNEGTVTTLLTLTNASAQEQIAHVTLWTDYAYPVMSFNVYLTGYDVHSISLHDVIWRGFLTPNGFNAGSGDFSIPNARLDLQSCANQPSAIPVEALGRMMAALTTGHISGCNTVGRQHENAVGYATIDVVRKCTTRNAEDPGYLTEDILWDNVLLGDY